MVAALDESDVKVPVFIRLTGTNEEDGRAILEGTQLIFAETLEDAAARAVNTGGAA
jgi:succinyl-CoA synthetase beta subunit